MNKLMLCFALLLTLGASVMAQDTSKLKDIKTIFVAELGSDEGSNLVREKIKIRLLKSKRFVLVEDEEKADAKLVGMAGSVNTGSYKGRFEGVGALRLVQRSSSETVWAYEYKSGMFQRGSASSNVAKTSIDRLERDAKAADKKP